MNLPLLLSIISAVKNGLEHKHILLENQRLADQVRRQQKQLTEQERILKTLEEEEPGITKVNWNKDGAIEINEEDYL